MPRACRGRGEMFLGVSGFGYPTWRGEFYPADAKPSDFLGLYAHRLPSVELNATARRFPTVEQLQRWADATPTAFRFAVKLTAVVVSRPAAAGRFCDTVRSLDQRLGPVLVPLPALGRHDGELASALFGALDTDLRYAIEPKDEAWDPSDVRKLARSLEHVIVNEQAPDDEFAYFRFREPPYTDDQLVAIATRVGELTAEGCDVYGYFKHEDTPTGPRYAKKVLEMSQKSA